MWSITIEWWYEDTERIVKESLRHETSGSENQFGFYLRRLASKLVTWFMEMLRNKKKNGPYMILIDLEISGLNL